MERRSFLRAGNKTLAAGALGCLLPRWVYAQTSAAISIRLLGSEPLTRVPASFVGLGYEMSSVARLGLLSTENAPYVQLLRNLGRSGVLRFGGIVADFTRYEAAGQVVTEPKNTVVTRGSLEQVSALLNEIGWTAIWSVNFGQGTLEEAITEARAVAGVLGPRLLALELGNEVENYSRGERPLRTPPYTFATYRTEYARWHDAIARAVPGVRFAAPDTAASVEWVEEMAKDAQGSVQLLTTHYYRGGQKTGTVEQLSTPDPALKTELERLRSASRSSGIPWRMCETNSFFGGGRPGVSNTLLGALWTLDYMLLLAQYGCSGVNLETGVNQLGFVSSYSPIGDNGQGKNTAGVPYYGMLACATALAAGPEVIPVALNGARPEVTAYALGAGGRTGALVVINRDAAAGVDLSFAELGMGRVRAFRLAGEPGVPNGRTTFAGAAVTADGRWTPTAHDLVQGEVRVDPMSAVVLVR